MALLWWGSGEDIEFIFRAAGVVSSAGGSYRNTYVRGALALPQGLPRLTGVLADTMPLSAPVTSCWFTGEYDNPGANNPDPSFGMGNRAAVIGGLFVGQATANQNKIALFAIDSGGTSTELAAEVGTTYNTNTLHRIDVQITNFNNAATNVKVFLEQNATPLINWTGDTTGLGFTTLDCVRLLAGANGSQGSVSEIIIADETTLPFVGVSTIYPDGAGDTNTFDSGTYQDIDELVLNDADMISSGSNGQEFECTLSDLTPGNFLVRGVKVADRADKGTVGPGTQQLGVKTGGTVNTVNKALTTTLENYERLMLVNPVTTNPWTLSEVNALQAAVKSAA